ncbi:MAG: ABC transporter permease subunit [Methanomassiliicoccales archaeon]
MNELLLIVLAVMATTARVLGLVLLSVVTGWLLAYVALKGKIFESIFLSLVEIFESVPVISFFPLVLVLFVSHIGGELGVELAADFLVFTAVVWNIWISEYQAFKTVPMEMLEVAENYRMGFFSRMANVYIPFSLPRIAANLFPSVSDGYFYITISEVFAIGAHSYATFGIGQVLDKFEVQGNAWGVGLSVFILGAFVCAVIVLLRALSKYVVAKYTLDTDAPIIRRGRLSIRQTTRVLSAIARNPLGRLAGYYRRTPRARMYEKEEKPRLGRYVWASVGLLLVALILYAAFAVIHSVSSNTWHAMFMQTPFIFYSMLIDYVRIAIILLIVFLFSALLGYYFALHFKAEAVGVPLIQVLSAYPAPIYFPFLFAALEPSLRGAVGPYSSDIFVILLGFISTFYYLFFSFWMGIKAMPAEYFDIMRNMNMGFFSRMRNVIIPGTFPYLVSGISSTVNSIWGGLIIGEYWPHIIGNNNLEIQTGLMKFIDINTAAGDIALAAWASVLFGIVVVVYSLIFTKRMMDIARKRYVAEEGVFGA